MVILRPGQRHVMIPGDAASVNAGRNTLHASGVSWWLAGGATGCVWAYQAVNAASEAAAVVNLANPGTYDLIAVGSPSWSAAGFYSNNASNYYRTVYTPASVDQNYTVIARVAGQAAVGAGGANRLYVWSRYVYNNDVVYGNGTSLIKAGALAAGNIAVSGNTGFRNGIAETGTLSAWSDPRLEMYVCAINGLSANHVGYVLAAALFRPAQSAAVVAALSAAMAAL